MKKLIFVMVVLSLMLTACGTKIQSGVAPDDNARQTQAIVEKWIAAYKDRDSKAIMALYSKELKWNVCTKTCLTFSFNLVGAQMPTTIARSSFKVDVKSYLVTNKGAFAALQVVYQDSEGDAKNPTPAVVILEILGDQISSETWYYIESY